MKKYAMLASLLASMLISAPPVAAQTPDGQPPAQETVCSPLKADGVTKALYGLCIAFCEAQDLASYAVPITEAELEALSNASPSGRILANYNKKRLATDPAMPCIKVEDPCPCWSAAELASIDGVGPGSTGISTYCTISSTQSIVQESCPAISAMASASSKAKLCQFINRQAAPPIARVFDVSQGTLTLEQLASCSAQVAARCTVLGLPGTGGTPPPCPS